MRVAFCGVPAVEIYECCRSFAVLMAAAVQIGRNRGSGDPPAEQMLTVGVNKQSCARVGATEQLLLAHVAESDDGPWSMLFHYSPWSERQIEESRYLILGDRHKQIGSNYQISFRRCQFAKTFQKSLVLSNEGYSYVIGLNKKFQK